MLVPDRQWRLDFASDEQKILNISFGLEHFTGTSDFGVKSE